MTDQLRAFLDVIAWAEIGPRLLAVSDNGYNVLVGSTAGHPVLFTSYADHPRKLVKIGKIRSTAAGRYQILSRIYDHYKAELRLSDFSPASQDAIAIQLLREVKAINPIEIGLFDVAIHRARPRWASLPGAGYGQPEKKIEDLRRVFAEAGGIIT